MTFNTQLMNESTPPHPTPPHPTPPHPTPPHPTPVLGSDGNALARESDHSAWQRYLLYQFEQKLKGGSYKHEA